MAYIAVVLQAPTSADRFLDAGTLLDYGFANFVLMDVSPTQDIPTVEVLLGEEETIVPVLSSSARVLVEKGTVDSVRTELIVAEDVQAPVELGQKLGEMEVWLGEELVETIPLVAGCEVEKLSLWTVFTRLLDCLFMVP